MTPFRSLYSSLLYWKVCYEWRGLAFAYLSLLIAVSLLPYVFKTHIEFVEWANQEALPVIEQIPTIEIVGGEVLFDESQPYYIAHPETGDVIAIIDTTGSITSLDEVEAKVLLTKSQVIIKKNSIETRSYSLSDIEELTIEQSTIAAWFSVIKSTSGIIIYPFMFIGLFVVKAFQVLLYPLLGFVFLYILKSKRNYTELLRISVVASTPAVVLKSIFLFFEIQITYAGFGLFLLTAFYLFWGVRAASYEVRA